MTDPRDTTRERKTEARRDAEPEVTPEVIKDLDVTSDDADVIRGGPCLYDTYASKPT